METAQNLIHASDGAQTAVSEIALWFGPGDLLAYSREIDRWVLAPDVESGDDSEEHGRAGHKPSDGCLGNRSLPGNCGSGNARPRATSTREWRLEGGRLHAEAAGSS